MAARARENRAGIYRLLRVISIPLFFGAWELVSRSGVVNEFLFPPPSVIAQALFDWGMHGQLVLDIAMSVSRVVVGYIIGATAGVAVGIATARYPALSSLLTPVFQILRPIPPIALVPIVILWLGLNEPGKYFLILWAVFFTVWISAHLGVQRVDPLLIRAAQALGTPEHRMLRELLLPGALPYIFVGLRTSLSVAFYTLVAAELAGAFAGVAYRIDIAHENLRIGLMMAGLVVLGVISACLDLAFEGWARHAMKWR
ncbi:MAG TPA: ABC transporter permease [Stellaceae bacterium]|nr:ABC transporter permease [Stellaceae bacterium]